MYNVPGPEELREWIRKHGLTVSEAGKLAGVDARAARRWTSPRDSASFRAIPWAAWALMRLLIGAATVAEIQEEVEPDDGR